MCVAICPLNDTVDSTSRTSFTNTPLCAFDISAHVKCSPQAFRLFHILVWNSIKCMRLCKSSDIYTVSQKKQDT